jgi:hypothetical protein
MKQDRQEYIYKLHKLLRNNSNCKIGFGFDISTGTVCIIIMACDTENGGRSIL